MENIEELIARIGQMLDEKLEQKLEEKLEEKLEQKLDEKLEQKLEEKLERNLDEKLNPKFEHFEQRLNSKFNNKFEEMEQRLNSRLFVFEQEYGTKISAIYDAVILEQEKNIEKSDKIRKLDKRVEKVEVNVFGHEKRISNLEMKQ